jgi:hypothetical protein
MYSLLDVYFTHQIDQTLFLVADIHSIVVIDRVNESHGEKEKPLSYFPLPLARLHGRQASRKLCTSQVPPADFGLM